MLSLEHHSDPVALLGSLINASVDNRVTVVVDSDGDTPGSRWVAGGRAADLADHAGLTAELRRIRDLGYLAS